MLIVSVIVYFRVNNVVIKKTSKNMEPIKTDLPTNTAEEKELLNLIAELIVEIIISETESADYKNTTSCSNVFFRYI